jgi:hypothetical protein
MQEPIDTRQPALVEAEIQRIYLEMFPNGNRGFVPEIFQWAGAWFGGRYLDFQPIDAHYHDLEHTLQGVLCMARILRSRQSSEQHPPLPRRLFELGMLAMLMHDTGYLKRRGDLPGTGAKYTLTHVDRSIGFAKELMGAHGCPPAEILAVKNMIHCTGINVKLVTIQFQSDLERIVGFSLGTADLLGQMAAPDYVDKLPVLYSELAEAAEHDTAKMKAGGFFSSAADLKRKTPLFWEKYVQSKINREFIGLYKFLNDPYPDGPNPYMDRIEANVARIRRELAGTARP